MSLFSREHAFSKTAVSFLYVLITVQLVFFCTHWEKYNTGVLFLSWGYDGLAIVYLLTYIFGVRSWQFFIYEDWRFVEAMQFGFYGICIGSLLVSCYNAYLSYEEGTARQSTLNDAFKPMYPVITLMVSSVLWAWYSPSNVMDVEPRAFLWTMGVIFSNIACRLIVAQMATTKCEAYNSLLALYVTIVALSIGGVLQRYEIATLKATALMVTGAHVHYGVCVVRQLCDHFNIMPFTLGKRRNGNNNGTVTNDGKKQRERD